MVSVQVIVAEVLRDNDGERLFDAAREKMRQLPAVDRPRSKALAEPTGMSSSSFQLQFM
jgi:hypothetical protein